MATVTRDLKTFSFSASPDTDTAQLSVTLDQSGGASATTFPADFDPTAITSVVISSFSSWLDEVNQNGDSLGLEVRIQTSGGVTLAGASSVQFQVALALTDAGGPYTFPEVDFVYVNQTGSVADWESFEIRYSQRYLKDMGADLCYLTGSPATNAYDKLTITYTPNSNVSVPVTGVEGTGEVDSVTVVGDAVAPVTSQPDAIGTGAVGTVDAGSTTHVNVPVTGVEASSEVGSVALEGNANLTVSGLEAAGGIGSVTVAVDVNVAVAGLLGTGKTGSTDTSTYYFDASIAGPSDPDTAWADDAKAFDGLTGATDFAFAFNAGSSSTNYLGGIGHSGGLADGFAIDSLRARMYGGSTEGDLEAEILYSGTPLGTITNPRPTGSANWWNWGSLSTPSGGWTWTKVNNLEVRFYGTDTGSTQIYKSEFEVTYYVPAAVVGDGNIDVTSQPDAYGTGEVGSVTAIVGESVIVTGLEATGSVGGVTIDASAEVAITGLSGTGAVGDATVTIAIVTEATGVAATGSVGSVTANVAIGVYVPVTGVEAIATSAGVFINAIITPTQDPNWAKESPTQDPNWAKESPTQDPNYTPIAPSQSSGWTEKEPTQNPNYTPVDPLNNANWRDGAISN